MNKSIYELRNMFRHVIRSSILSMVGMFFFHTANAALLDGKTIEFVYLFNTIDTIYPSDDNGNYLVGPGVEIPNGICCNFEGSVDFSDTNILADFYSSGSYTPASFNGFRITDIFDTIDPFTSVTINSLTNMIGFDASRITFDQNNIWVNWQGLSFTADTYVSIDLATSVPEPATLALLSFGLLGVGISRKRKARRNSIS